MKKEENQEETSQINPTLLADDILNGVTEIAEVLGQSRRRTYHLLVSGKIPAFQLGRRWHARRSTLLNFIEDLENGGVA